MLVDTGGRESISEVHGGHTVQKVRDSRLGVVLFFSFSIMISASDCTFQNALSQKGVKSQLPVLQRERKREIAVRATE